MFGFQFNLRFLVYFYKKKNLIFISFFFISLYILYLIFIYYIYFSFSRFSISN